MQDTTTIKGTCHCGNIRFLLKWPDSSPEVPVRVCGCTYCQKHGGAWTSHPDARLDVHIDKPTAVSRYRFGTKTADFHVCSICGVAPFVTSDIEDGLYAVVSVNAFDDAEDLAYDRSATDFDGEDTGSRLDRRRRNWIGDVHIVR